MSYQVKEIFYTLQREGANDFLSVSRKLERMPLLRRQVCRLFGGQGQTSAGQFGRRFRTNRGVVGNADRRFELGRAHGR